MSINFSYDEDSDVLTIEGVKYSGELFRSWGFGGISLGRPFMILSRNDGVISIFTFTDIDAAIEAAVKSSKE